MSSSDGGSEAESAIAAAARTAWQEAEKALAGEGGGSGEISDETVQLLLTAGARLFAKKLELECRYFDPFTAPNAVTATDVASTVCEMLRAADLNTFDLSMWFHRPR